MVCISLLGCGHIHRSASSYFLLGLMIACALLGLRILLYIVARCLQQCQQSPTLGDDGDDIIEMQARSTLALHRYYRHQWRRSAVVATAAATSSLPPRDEWQSKLVIAAGCDHVSYIAQPCPLQTSNASS